MRTRLADLSSCSYYVCFPLVTRLIAEQIRYHDEQRQHEMNSSVPTVVSFRIPAIMIDILLGIEDEQALLIAYETETELTLHFQSCTFTISIYNNDIRRAVRSTEGIINDKY
ncbi:hypothetical protein DINM_005752 [Dirofilaria immitis]|nr:hypothetical protein [Dirofilaria immitis]